MNIGIPNETSELEHRVALDPSKVTQLLDEGYTVSVETGAGRDAGWPDSAYQATGATISPDRETLVSNADVIFRVSNLANDDSFDPSYYSAGQLVIGLLGPHASVDSIESLAARDTTCVALELIPRTSRAQSMDAVSSNASLGGYQSAILAANEHPKLFPMQMTAAGTVSPAEVFVVGAGVAGLQAIATADRLGASVKAYDIRPEVKEEVESLGAEFVVLDLEAEDASDEEGHAREQDEEFYRKQREMMTRVVSESDVVITTAAIPGKPAPELVTSAMIAEMTAGSVIVDLAAGGGGNCEPTVANEVVSESGVSIHGPTNLPSMVPHTASQLYTNNLINYLHHVVTSPAEFTPGTFDTSDNIVDSTLLTLNGTLRHPHTASTAEDEE